MDEEKDKKNYGNDEGEELDIEEITDIQGGLDDDNIFQREQCGLGCFIGTGY
jgi:hypothetical protein